MLSLTAGRARIGGGTVMARREVIDVKVVRRVLWVGAEAYPLRNIARATTINSFRIE
jgi:hypothetical protein